MCIVHVRCIRSLARNGRAKERAGRVGSEGGAGEDSGVARAGLQVTSKSRPRRSGPCVHLERVVPGGNGAGARAEVAARPAGSAAGTSGTE